MNIVSLALYRYRLPLAKDLTLAGKRHTVRDGLILRVATDDGSAGLGEIAPLPGFSSESMEEAQDCTLTWMRHAANRPLQEIQAAFLHPGAGETACPTVPSAAFGIGTALHMASERSLGDWPEASKASRAAQIPINALLMGNYREITEQARNLDTRGFRAIKLKVGTASLARDVELVRELHDMLGNRLPLRLDANRAWDLEDATAFALGIAGIPIEYIEEPLQDPAGYETFWKKTGIPFALDETLQEMAAADLRAQCASNLENEYVRWILTRARALILKPTLLGWRFTMDIATRSRAGYICPKAVFSSAFESRLGLIAIANMTAAVYTPGAQHRSEARQIPAAGLDTETWFKQDPISRPLPIHDGMLHLDEANRLLDTLTLERLEEAGCA